MKLAEMKDYFKDFWNEFKKEKTGSFDNYRCLKNSLKFHKSRSESPEKINNYFF